MLTGTAVPYTHVNAGSEGKLTDGLVREMKPKAKSGCGVRNRSLENSATLLETHPLSPSTSPLDRPTSDRGVALSWSRLNKGECLRDQLPRRFRQPNYQRFRREGADVTPVPSWFRRPP